MVKIVVGSVWTKFDIDAKNFVEHMIHPQSGWGGRKQIIVVGKDMPNFAVVSFNRATMGCFNAQRLEGDALAKQHAINIVIWSDQQVSGILKRFVQGKPRWVSVAVGADNGQVFDAVVKTHGNLAHCGVCWHKAFRIERELVRHYCYSHRLLIRVV